MKKYYILLASLILAVLGLAQLGEAQSAAPLTVTEVDGSPTRTGIRKLVVSNGTLTIAGQTATVTTGGGGGGGSVNVNGASVSSPDFNGTTPAAPAGGINTTWQVSGSSVSGYWDASGLARAIVRKPIFWSDFIVANEPYGTATIASGTSGSAAIVAEHPGIVFINSSTTTNSGANIRLSTDRILLAGGERADIVFQTPSSITSTTLRFGFHDCATSADAVDGVYFELPGTLNLVGKTSNNSTRTTSSTIATLANSTWYHGVIVLNSNATQVDFTIYSDAGSSLGTQSVATNIPTASGRTLTSAFIATNSGTTAVNLVNIDYISVAWTRALVRGQ